MRRLITITLLSLACVSCNQQPKEETFVCPSSLDEMEFLYLESTLNYDIIHANPKCSKTIVYIKKNDHRRRRADPCGKCVSPELAKELLY